MCFGSKAKATVPAAAPAPALEPPEVPEIGDARRKENIDAFGEDAPNYRVKRKTKSGSVNPDSDIVM